MPKLSAEIKNRITSLQKKELEQIVLKLASKDSTTLDFLLVNYLEKESGKMELFEKTKISINHLIFKSYKGFSEQLQLANLLKACSKVISDFSKITSDKKLEADLLIYILEYIFSQYTNLFGTCFTAFDFKVAQMVKRLSTIVDTKLHEDLKGDYAEKINHYSEVLNRTSRHIGIVRQLN
jgi:hypothetical protein